MIDGVGAVLHGVPLATFDLDLVHARGARNRERLAQALVALDACYREHLPERLVPSANDLASSLHHLLSTRLGNLDLLGTIHGGLEHEDLLARSVPLTLDTGVTVRVLDLRGLIELKERSKREKDQLQLGLLRATQAAREARER